MLYCLFHGSNHFNQVVHLKQSQRSTTTSSTNFLLPLGNTIDKLAYNFQRQCFFIQTISRYNTKLCKKHLFGITNWLQYSSSTILILTSVPNSSPASERWRLKEMRCTVPWFWVRNYLEILPKDYEIWKRMKYYR